LTTSGCLNSDRGCQFTSAQLARFARDHNLARSVGRTGVCWDNAQQELFWRTMKVELFDRYLWSAKAVAKLAVGDWIERVYNRRRRHSAIGMTTPVDYENQITQTASSRLTLCPPNGVTLSYSGGELVYGSGLGVDRSGDRCA